jgi:hypothetical protein
MLLNCTSACMYPNCRGTTKKGNLGGLVACITLQVSKNRLEKLTVTDFLIEFFALYEIRRPVADFIRIQQLLFSFRYINLVDALSPYVYLSTSWSFKKFFTLKRRRPKFFYISRLSCLCNVPDQYHLY